jgi:DNA-binding LacI/PurR family transcriptional regulator
VPPRSRSRQADVAAEAGVSQSTVSMVLTGHGDVSRISAETQSQVRAAARRLGYAPRRSANGGRANTAGLLIGVHTFEPIFPTVASDYYFDFLRGIEEQAVADRCNLVLFTSTQTSDGERRIYEGGVNLLRHAAGTLLLGRQPNNDDLTRLVRDHYPFVYIGHRELRGESIPYVGGDYAAATSRIVEHLVNLGHRRFGYLGAPARSQPQVDRWDGFRDALDRLALPAPEPSYSAADALGVQWLDDLLGSGVTALLVETVGQARTVAALTALRGVRIPQDLSVVRLVDDTDPAPGRPWSCLHVPRYAMGRRAARLLVRLLSDPAGEYERQILLPCELSLDESTAPPGTAA